MFEWIGFWTSLRLYQSLICYKCKPNQQLCHPEQSSKWKIKPNIVNIKKCSLSYIVGRQHSLRRTFSLTSEMSVSTMDARKTCLSPPSQNVSHPTSKPAGWGRRSHVVFYVKRSIYKRGSSTIITVISSVVECDLLT